MNWITTIFSTTPPTAISVLIGIILGAILTGILKEKLSREERKYDTYKGIIVGTARAFSNACNHIALIPIFSSDESIEHIKESEFNMYFAQIQLVANLETVEKSLHFTKCYGEATRDIQMVTAEKQMLEMKNSFIGENDLEVKIGNNKLIGKLRFEAIEKSINHTVVLQKALGDFLKSARHDLNFEIDRVKFAKAISDFNEESEIKTKAYLKKLRLLVEKYSTE